MKAKAILMSQAKNRYGYTPRIEELSTVAKQSPGTFLFRNHQTHESPMGRVLEARILFDEKLGCLVVEGVLEIYEDKLGAEEMNGVNLSQAYTDGGFFVDESDGRFLPPMELTFDAYNTDETELYLRMKEISKELNIGIVARRMRRHEFTSTAFLFTAIGSYFLKKVLDDTGLYEKLKKLLLGGSKNTNEVMIDVVSEHESRNEKHRLRIRIKGKDVNDINIKIDSTFKNEQKFLFDELEKFKNEYKDKEMVGYDVDLLDDERGKVKLKPFASNSQEKESEGIRQK